MTTIVLTRHGHVAWLDPERFRGRAELKLSETGIAQAEATARRIEASWQAAALYASPMGRTLWFRRPDLVQIPGGETLQDVLARAATALRMIVRRHRDQTVILVGHDSVNRVLLLHALELPLARYWQLGQDPCAINLIEASAEGFQVRTMNETWHLQEVGDRRRARNPHEG